MGRHGVQGGRRTIHGTGYGYAGHELGGHHQAHEQHSVHLDRPLSSSYQTMMRATDHYGYGHGQYGHGQYGYEGGYGKQPYQHHHDHSYQVYQHPLPSDIDYVYQQQFVSPMDEMYGMGYPGGYGSTSGMPYDMPQPMNVEAAFDETLAQLEAMGNSEHVAEEVLHDYMVNPSNYVHEHSLHDVLHPHPHVNVFTGNQGPDPSLQHALAMADRLLGNAGTGGSVPQPRTQQPQPHPMHEGDKAAEERIASLTKQVEQLTTLLLARENEEKKTEENDEEDSKDEVDEEGEELIRRMNELIRSQEGGSKSDSESKKRERRRKRKSAKRSQKEKIGLQEDDEEVAEKTTELDLSNFSFGGSGSGSSSGGKKKRKSHSSKYRERE
eukprot:TRINITY_DN273_c1_g2_i1.p1 TRINITY_DN273_c1_g2~~TRINITY_DN273_c1_g2_i1.p1  ORF type:complete len:381 (+),score=126.57 TRINITY_DN273_c1_g2_i1:248-1390(+)